MVTFKAFKEMYRGGYYTRAAEDIPGFARKGHSLYGDCDDMLVVGFTYHPGIVVYTVYLAKHF